MAYTLTTEITPGTITAGKPCVIDTNTYIVWKISSSTATFYQIDFDGSAVSSTTLTGTISSCAEVGGMVPLTSSKFAVCHSNSVGTYGYSRVATLSGTTLTWGSSSSGTSQYTSGQNRICALSDSKYVTIQIGGNATKLRCCTVSGTTITSGTSDDVGGAGAGNAWPHIWKIDTDKFGFSYSDSSGYPSLWACTVSGTTITRGTDKKIATHSGGSIASAMMDSTYVTYAYDDGRYRFGYLTLSGTTWSDGSYISRGGTGATHIDMELLSGGDVAILGQDNLGSGNVSVMQIGNLTGTTLTVDSGQQIYGAYQYHAASNLGNDNLAFARYQYTKVGYLPSGPANVDSFISIDAANIDSVDGLTYGDISAINGIE